MAIGDLIAQPLTSQSEFNWVLLIELLLCGVLYAMHPSLIV
jgi:hypothetical protein